MRNYLKILSIVALASLTSLTVPSAVNLNTPPATDHSALYFLEESHSFDPLLRRIPNRGSRSSNRSIGNVFSLGTMKATGLVVNKSAGEFYVQFN